MITRTTAAEFREFKKWVKHYVRLLGVDGLYDVRVEHVATPTPSGVSASCAVNQRSRWLIISLYKWLDHDIVMPSMRSLAAHESCHGLLADMNDAAESRFVTHDQIDRIEERIVCVLERVLAKV